MVERLEVARFSSEQLAPKGFSLLSPSQLGEQPRMAPQVLLFRRAALHLAKQAICLIKAALEPGF